MNYKLRMILLSHVFMTIACAQIEWIGYTDVGTRKLFVISNKADGNSSPWLKLGDRYGDYLLDAYDEQAGLLTVRKGELIERLKLARSKVEKAEIPKKEHYLVELTLTLDGHFAVGDREIQGSEIEEYFKKIVLENPNAVVAIRGISPGDMKSPNAVKLFQAMKSAGIKRFIFRAEPVRK